MPAFAERLLENLGCDRVIDHRAESVHEVLRGDMRSAREAVRGWRRALRQKPHLEEVAFPAG